MDQNVSDHQLIRKLRNETVNIDHTSTMNVTKDRGREVYKFNITPTSLNFMTNKHRNQTAVAENTGHA